MSFLLGMLVASLGVAAGLVAGLALGWRRGYEDRERGEALSALAGEPDELPVIHGAVRCPICRAPHSSFRVSGCHPSQRIGDCRRADVHVHTRCEDCNFKWIDRAN